jgi:hypothetical protein
MITDHPIQVVVQKMPEIVQAPAVAVKWWKDGNLWTAVGAVGTVGAAFFAYMAARVSKKSADESKESVEISRRSAELLEKQYQQQINKEKPALTFSRFLIMNDSDPQNINRDIRIYYLKGFDIDITNKRGEDFLSIDYVYVILTKDKMIAINQDFINLSYSRINKYRLSVTTKGKHDFNGDNFYVFLFLNVCDTAYSTSFTVYGRHITESCFSDVTTLLQPDHTPDSKDLYSINDSIYTYITNVLEKDKRDRILNVLQFDQHFKTWLEFTEGKFPIKDSTSNQAKKTKRFKFRFWKRG